MRFGGVLRVKVVILVLLLVLPFSVSSQVILDPPVTIRLKNVDVVIQTRLYSSVDMLVGENSFTINGTSLVVESPEAGVTLYLKRLDVNRGVIELEGEGKEVDIAIGWDFERPYVKEVSGKVRFLKVEEYAAEDRVIRIAAEGSGIAVTVSPAGLGEPKEVMLGGERLNKDQNPGWSIVNGEVVIEAPTIPADSLLSISWKEVREEQATTTQETTTTTQETTTVEITTEETTATSPTVEETATTTVETVTTAEETVVTETKTEVTTPQVEVTPQEELVEQPTPPSMLLLTIMLVSVLLAAAGFFLLGRRR